MFNIGVGGVTRVWAVSVIVDLEIMFAILLKRLHYPGTNFHSVELVHDHMISGMPNVKRPLDSGS